MLTPFDDIRFRDLLLFDGLARLGTITATALACALLPLAAACEKPVVDAEPPPFVEVPFPIDELLLTGFVDPMIGSRGLGNVIPGALVPHGVVRLSPDTLGTPGDVDAYEWNSDRIEGFTHTHWEGPGGGSNGYSQLLVLPQVGALNVNRAERPTLYSHNDEEARPGYYAVTLDSGVRAELTATGHAAVHRYSFPAGDGRLLFDLGHSLGFSEGAVLEMRGGIWEGEASYNIHPLAALLTPDRETAHTTLYFHAELSQPPSSTGVFRGQADQPDVSPGATDVVGRWVGGWSEWSFEAPAQIELRIGISLISVEQAAANLSAEVGDKSFDQVAQAADALWNAALNRVQIEADPQTQTKFYTALYHSLFQPADYTEANGQYVVGASGSPEVRTVGTDGFHYFTDDWCMWDTFRTSHPLRTLVEPELVDDISTSMLVHFEEGGWLPKCSWNATGYSRVMIGNHAVPIIVDGFLKGLDRIDVDLAWEAIDRAGSDEIPDLPDGGCGYVNLGTPQEYIDLGYVPSECDPTQSVSMTLEHAYDDWATARFAEAIGRSDDAARYDDRGTWWLNHWNPDEGFMQARDRAGDWVTPFDPTDDSDFNDFAEADSWIYSWFVPHDVPGLLDAMGGLAPFTERLDAFFDDGHFDPSNQPSFHVPWLYAAAGDPAGTQRRVRDIVEDDYGIDPSGLPGNDDAGSTSAFLVLAMLGVYPIAPGDGVWTLTSPRVRSATLHLHPGYYPGGQVEIVTVGDPNTQFYVQSATWNGEPLTAARIDHAALMEGGRLEFVLGDLPSTWGSSG